MRKIIFIFTIIVIVFSASCTEHYEKDFYGGYTMNDSTNMLNSKITFYENNTYSFNFQAEMGNNHDSGSFVLGSNTIFFTSFNKEKDKYDIEHNVHVKRTLTNKQFIYQRNRIGYINKNVSENGHPIKDTTFWLKK